MRKVGAGCQNPPRGDLGLPTASLRAGSERVHTCVCVHTPAYVRAHPRARPSVHAHTHAHTRARASAPACAQTHVRMHTRGQLRGCPRCGTPPPHRTHRHERAAPPRAAVPTSPEHNRDTSSRQKRRAGAELEPKKGDPGRGRRRTHGRASCGLVAKSVGIAHAGQRASSAGAPGAQRAAGGKSWLLPSRGRR